jgi:FixJ family two-component response regulator
MNFARTEIPTVFVVDDDASIRDSLGLLIRCAGWQARISASAEEFLARPRATTPSCLLAELHLPGLSGFELQSVLIDRTEMPIIFMCRQADVPAAVRVMKAGAFEVLPKPYVSDALLSAIGRALECSSATLHSLARIRALQARFESLSPREREVMALVVSGRMNKQVGGELGISEITVKAHRGKLMRKMRAGSLAELVRMAVNLRPDPSAFASYAHV